MQKKTLTMQRMQLAVVEMENIPSVVQAGGNPMPIVKNFFERIGSNNLDEIFPDDPTDQQAAEMKRFTEAQEQQNALAEQQLQLSQLQTEILSREQERLDADTQRKIDETIGQLTRWQAQNILDMEKAESEDVKNGINKYTAELDGQIKILTAIGADNVRRDDIRNQVTASQAANIPGGVQ